MRKDIPFTTCTVDAVNEGARHMVPSPLNEMQVFIRKLPELLEDPGYVAASLFFLRRGIVRGTAGRAGTA